MEGPEVGFLQADGFTKESLGGSVVAGSARFFRGVDDRSELGSFGHEGPGPPPIVVQQLSVVAQRQATQDRSGIHESHI